MIQLEQRMYTLNKMYFMGIQAGIQSLHSVADYVFKYSDQEDLIRWATKDKTVIVLVGGFSNDLMLKQDPTDPVWGMNHALHQLEQRGIKHAAFYETMANNCLSSIAFLVDERVWNRKKYPDVEHQRIPEHLMRYKGAELEAQKRQREANIKAYGEDVIWMREFLNPYRLAS
jgi:hypothetical protein